MTCAFWSQRGLGVAVGGQVVWALGPAAHGFGGVGVGAVRLCECGRGAREGGVLGVC